jgi:hypothetical protein
MLVLVFLANYLPQEISRFRNQSLKGKVKILRAALGLQLDTLLSLLGELRDLRAQDQGTHLFG